MPGDASLARLAEELACIGLLVQDRRIGPEAHHHRILAADHIGRAAVAGPVEGILADLVEDSLVDLGAGSPAGSVDKEVGPISSKLVRSSKT